MKNKLIILLSVSFLFISMCTFDFGTNENNYNYFGSSITMNDDYLVIGSPANSEAGATEGHIYIYSKNANQWKKKQIIKAEYKYFGSDSYIYEYNQIIAALSSSLNVYNYYEDSNSWILSQDLSVDNNSKLSTYQNYLFASEYSELECLSVDILENNDNIWSQLQNMNCIDNEDPFILYSIYDNILVLVSHNYDNSDYYIDIYKTENLSTWELVDHYYEESISLLDAHRLAFFNKNIAILNKIENGIMTYIYSLNDDNELELVQVLESAHDCLGFECSNPIELYEDYLVFGSNEPGIGECIAIYKYNGVDTWELVDTIDQSPSCIRNIYMYKDYLLMQIYAVPLFIFTEIKEVRNNKVFVYKNDGNDHFELIQTLYPTILY